MHYYTLDCHYINIYIDIKLFVYLRIRLKNKSKYAWECREYYTISLTNNVIYSSLKQSYIDLR